MVIQGEDIIWTIIYTMMYTIISMFMSFRFVDLLGDDPSVEKLMRHFLLWPIEGLVILTLCIKCYIEEHSEDKIKLKKK